MLTLLSQAVPAPTETQDIIKHGLDITSHALIYFALAIVIYVVLLFGGRTLKRRLALPINWAYHLFCLAAALFIPSYLPHLDILGKQHTGALLIITGAFVLTGFVRHYFFDILFQQKNNTQVPKFLSEVVAISIMVSAALIVWGMVYNNEVHGLLAGAGVAGIVLGLALQDTLGNIFSGFSIYFGGLFKAGDWLFVDGKHAQIVEINWRSTRLRTTDEVCLDIPNSSITKQTVVNYNFPSSIHAMRLDIGLEYDAPPTLVKEILIEAALDCPHVLREPVPDVFLNDFASSSVTYQLRYWISDHAKFNPAASSIRTTLWYALRRHNISIPYPVQQQVILPSPKPHAENKNLIRESISKTIIASCLSPDQIGQIVDAARIVCFGKGENIIRGDAEAGPMFVLAQGSAEVWIEAGGILKSVAVLGPDACIGENSVLTGERRSATVVALEDCLAVEVDKSTLAPIISASPELLESLSDLLAGRRMQNEGIVAEAAGAVLHAKKIGYKAGFLEKLKTFFSV